MIRRPGSSAVAMCAAAVLVVCGPAATAAPPAPRPLAQLDEQFAAAARDLVRRARADGHDKLAELVAGWQLPAPTDRQFAFAIPARLEVPAWIEEAAARSIWDDFVAARRARAAGIYDLAVVAAAAHDRPPTRAEQARPDPESPPLPQRSCAVVQLLAAALRDDPGHERARGALGWVRRGDAWFWPEAAARLDRHADYDPAFGWLPAGRLARYRAGERYDRGRWISAAEDAAHTPPVDRGRRFETDHWEILSAAPVESAAALAERLEETFLVWVQIFGGFAVEPADLEKRVRGRGRVMPRDAFAAVLCADREQYAAELGRLEPLAPRTDGLYWAPTRTAWFFAAAPDVAAAAQATRAATIHHEATHQIFLELAPTGPRHQPLPAGERSGFWAIEAVACHMESIRPTPFGWTVGGRDAGRVPAARGRLVEEGVHVPLAELAALGRKAFQADARLPALYDEVAGLADFFMNGRNGRYREAFLEYLSRVYAGIDDPDTLPRLCRRSAAELDAEYRDHLR
jgi:hypothetical protein